MTLPAGATSISPPFGFGAGRGGAAVPSPIYGSRGEQQIARSLEIYLPDVLPIPEAQLFNVQGNVDSPGAETDVLIPNVTVQLPAGSIGVIRGLSIYVNDMLQTTDVQFTLRFDGNPVNGFSRLSMFPRLAPSVSNGFDTLIRVPMGVAITVTYTNVDGGVYKVGASFSGWSWPATSGDRWIGLGY